MECNSEFIEEVDSLHDPDEDDTEDGDYQDFMQGGPPVSFLHVFKGVSPSKDILSSLQIFVRAHLKLLRSLA